MNDELPIDTSPAELAEAAQSIARKIVSELKDAVSKPDISEPRLFFPEGIELIGIEVKVGPADVEVKVAGPKGSEHVLSGVRKTRKVKAEDAADPDAPISRNVVDTDSVVAAVGQEIIWYNNTQLPETITFFAGPAGKASPLVDFAGNYVDNFPVPPNGGVVATFVAPRPAGEYDYAVEPKPTPLLGNPSIIIQ